MSDTWIILGATSSMARAFTRLIAEQGGRLVLAGRDTDDMDITAADARARGATGATVVRFDARKPKTFADVIEAAGPGVLNAAVFLGSMPEQADINANPALLDGTIADSFTGPARFLQTLALRVEAEGDGVIVGVGSVAGDRGRASNYVYGSAKAGFHAFLSGLRGRLLPAGGHVVTVKPGFVDTAMTWGLFDRMTMVADPDDVARTILRAADKRRNVVYVPLFWLGIMTIIRAIPEPVFKKLKL